MNRFILLSATIVCWALCALTAVSQELTPLSTIKAISNDEAKEHMAVAFEATVTYSRPYEKVLFVQDGDAAIFVSTPTTSEFAPGDRVLVRGTMQESFRPFVEGSNIRILGKTALPTPVQGTFDAMIRAKTDCQLVTVRAVIRAADLLTSPNYLRTTTYLNMLVDGEQVTATLDNDDENALKGLLDAEVEITGVASGQFDNKMQQTGVLIHIQSLDGIKVLKRASVDPWSITVTPMDRVVTGLRQVDLSQRMRVHGAITYYQPGIALVLQNGDKSVWISTGSSHELRIGDLADAIGFPDVQNGFLTLAQSEVHDSFVQAPIVPQLFTWKALATGGNGGRSHIFDLVSIEGQVVTEVRQATQDEYVLQADDRLFSAILRHPGTSSRLAFAPMRQIPVGTRIRVTGICMLEDANPFNGEVPFNILMRSYDDIAIVAQPPWLNVRHLVSLIGLLILAIFIVGGWAWYIERKMRRQTSSVAYVEQRRSRILEAMNASRPLAETLEEITELVSFKLQGAPSWCEITSGATLGNCPSVISSKLSVVEHPIPSAGGQSLGTFYAAVWPQLCGQAGTREALVLAAGLAQLAIETSRLHTDLVHRSEFDLLTDVGNRFSLEKHLDSLIETARQTAGTFGLIYIDLNEFKQVNDLYGHQVGDIYLQQAAQRMKKQLRPADTLARLGGDEFAVMVPEARSRNILLEIAQRLERCFEQPFPLGNNIVYRGSASIGVALYPEDAGTKDGLLRAADSAMYTAKKARQQRTHTFAREPKPETVHEAYK
ncbi:MAG TPA: diguanylate cyclase [Terracidiphilus sp.]|nr:diguanylate cyclase [Terracidiphilus sp.]